MSKPGLILIGSGGHAHACIDVVEQQGNFSVAGLVGMPDEVNSSHFGYLVIGEDKDLPELAREYQFALIAVGQIASPEPRIRLYQAATDLGFQFSPIVSPTAHVSPHASIGIGSIVMHGAIVNAGARVGYNCIVNTRSVLEHDCVVGNHCHISTGAILNGNVNIGSGSFVGSGSIVKEGISIGRNVIVGMGLAVRRSQGDGVRYVGSSRL